MTKAKAILKNMRVKEISLVGDGDNPGADVLILKMRDVVGVDIDVVKQRIAEAREAVASLAEIAAGGGEEGDADVASAILKGCGMDIEQLSERLGEIESNLDTVTKAKDAAEARVAELEAEIAKRDASTDDGTTDEDEVLKGLPEPVRKRLIDAEATAASALEQVEKARDEREVETRVAKARELGIADADNFGALLHRIAKGKTTADDETALVEIVTKAKAFKDGESILFERIGKAQGGDAEGAEAQAKLDEAITLIQKAKPSLTREQAYAEAIDANPALYDEVKKIAPSA